MSKILYELYAHTGTTPRAVPEPNKRKQCDDRSPEDGIGITWRCTRRKGHEGQHVAHSNGVPCLAWMSDDE